MFDKDLKYLLLIILIFIAACIETDIYLPAFTDMMAYFAVSPEEIQGLLSWNFVGICVSGPLYGPLSDSFGRKRPLLIALGLFFIGSLATLFAQNFSFMLFGRILQGLGCGGCFTLGMAIIFDSFSGEKAIQALARINSIVPVIMAAAPIIGGYLNEMYGFRSNFLAIAVIVLASLIVCILFFAETLPEENRVPFDIRRIASDFKKVSLSLPFWQTTAIVSLLFAGYITFLSGISVLFVIEFGITKEILPYFQAALLGAWVLANLLCSRVIRHWGIPLVKNTGIALFLVGGILMLLAVLIAPQNPYFLTSAMILYCFGANWVQGVYFPEGMALFPDIKGITASLLTSARLLITAAAVAAAASFYNATVYPLAGVMLIVIVGNLAVIYFYEKGKKKQMTATSSV